MIKPQAEGDSLGSNAEDEQVVLLDEPSHANSLVMYIWLADRILGDGEVSGL